MTRWRVVLKRFDALESRGFNAKPKREDFDTNCLCLQRTTDDFWANIHRRRRARQTRVGRRFGFSGLKDRPREVDA